MTQTSRISFRIEQRTSTFYVFALFAEQDRALVNPQDLFQWRFWLEPTADLPEQKSIGLTALVARFGEGLSYSQLQEARAQVKP